MTIKRNSRHLTPFEYYETVQLEYLCSKLRSKIYPRKTDKDYWNRVAEGKRVTIEQISSRNKLPNIFTDSDLLAAMERRLYREDTYPSFLYKDEEQKLSQEYLDLLYYYRVGTQVRFLKEEGIEEYQVGVVKSYQPPSSTIKIDFNGEEIVTKIHTTKRIF